MSRRVVTEASKALMFELREERGLSYAAIGRQLGISHGAVSWHCLIEGVEKPGPLPPCRQTVPLAGVQRGNHLLRGFSPEEDAAIIALSKAGLGDTAIARQLPTARKANSIRGRLAVLARREARAEADA